MRRTFIAAMMAGSALVVSSQLTFAQTREAVPQDRSGVAADPTTPSGRSTSDIRPTDSPRKIEDGTASGKGSGPGGGSPNGN